MLIYLRKIDTKRYGEMDEWMKYLNDSMDDTVESTSIMDYHRMILETKVMLPNTYLYSVEKGDEDFGVFSYTIAKLCLVDVDETDSSAEIVLFSINDNEWNNEAKVMAVRNLLNKAFNELNLNKLFIKLDKEDSDIRIFENLGFEAVGNKDDLTVMEIGNRMKILVTGAAGKLGYDVVRELSSRGHIVLGSDIEQDFEMVLEETGNAVPYSVMDITDSNQVNKIVEDFKPDAIIHCSAWTAVDDAEIEKNRSAVYDINVKGTENLARACRNCGAKMMYITTDYAFDGSGNMPWDADSKDFAPLNYYGQTKLDGENAVTLNLEKYFVIRTEWAFGKNGHNFVDVLLEAAKHRKQITVVDDQVGTPTYFYDLSRLLADMIVTDKYGFYNATNSGGYVSRYEYAKEIFRQAAALGHEEYSEKNLTVSAVSSEECGLSKTVRPLNSRLDNSKLVKAGFEELPEWRDALGRYLKEKEF